MIDSLIVRGDLDEGEESYLPVLTDIVAKYEAQEHPMPSVSDAEMLRHIIEAKGVAQLNLAAATGIANSTISEILAGKHGLTRQHIGVLCRYFHVNPTAFSFDS